MNLIPKPLTQKAFEAFGDVIGTEGKENITINDGFAQKYFNICTLDANEQGGKSALHLYVAKKREFPLRINMLEKHPFFSQAFMPRSHQPFIAVVALGADKPDLSTLKAFITNGNQGVHYSRGIWHFPLLSLEEAEQFIVLDRTDLKLPENKIEECIEHYFGDDEIILSKD